MKSRGATSKRYKLIKLRDNDDCDKVAKVKSKLVMMKFGKEIAYHEFNFGQFCGKTGKTLV